MPSIEIPFDAAAEAFEIRTGPGAELAPEAPAADAADQAYPVDLDEDDYSW